MNSIQGINNLHRWLPININAYKYKFYTNFDSSKITTVYLRVLVEEFIPEQNTTQTIRLIHGQHPQGRNYTESKLNFESASATWLGSGER